MSARMLRLGIVLCLLGLWAGSMRADQVVTVTGVTGHDGGNWPATLGHLSDMCNGNLSYDFGTADHNPGMNTSTDPSDPSTWLFINSAWAQEWKANSRLDTNTALNAKMGWAVLGFGSVTTNLSNLFLWNVRSGNTTENVDTYNLYTSSGVGIDALPAMPNSKQTAGDYDFSSGDWTLLNTGGALTLPVNGSNNNTPQATVSLGGINARYIGIEILTAGGAASRVGLAQVEVTMVDAVAPGLLSLSPTNNATQILASVDLVATFDESIAVNSGNVIITNLTDATGTTIAIGDAQVSVSNATLTINPSADLEAGDTFAVLIEPGAVQDLSGNDFAGITNTATWPFTTLSVSAPTAGLSGGASDPGPGSATLNGILTAGGSADAFICWGETDGGTTGTGGWDNVIAMGLAIDSVPFATEVNGLIYGVSYAYRVYVTNAADSDWSDLDAFVCGPPEASPVPTDGLLGMWTFDDGTAADVSGNGHNGTDVGAPTYSTDTPSGSGMSVDFNGGDNGILVGGDENDFDVDRITIAAWVKELPDGGWEPYIAKRGEGGEGYQLRRQGGSDDITFTIRGTSGADDPGDIDDRTHVVRDNETMWCHLVARYDGSRRQIIINGDTGNPASDIADTGAIGDADEALAFGNRRNGTGWDGSWSRTWLDDVFIYDRALNDTEVSQLYENVGSYDAPPVGITNTTAANVTTESADLQGILNATQAVFSVHAYYSTNNNIGSAAWLADGAATNVLIGVYSNVQGQAVSVTVSNLVAPQTYYYTLLASNAATNMWASPNVSFSTVIAESDPPTIVALNPTNSAADVPRDQNLVATFDEAVVLGAGGVIIVTNLTDATGSTITLPDDQVSVVTSNLTINPAAELDAVDTYAVLIDSNAVKDVFGNAFTGIHDTSTWRFSMDEPPVILSLNPTNGTSDASPDGDLVATFDEAVALVGGGVITITNLTEGSAMTVTMPDTQVSADGSVVTIYPDAVLDAGDTYAVLIDTNTIEDAAGNLFAGIVSTGTWQFSIADDPNWSLVAYWPLTHTNTGAIANGATIATEPGLDDVIDNSSHPATDATSTGTGNAWAEDAERGIVYKTSQGSRLSCGTQGITGDFTWSLWVKILDDNNGTIMGTRAGNPWNKLTTGGMNTWAGFNFGYTLPLNSDWIHLVVRGAVNPGGSDQKVQCFIDGALAATDNNTASLAFNGALQLGGNDSWSEDIDGLMHDVAIWDEALSDERIELLAAGGAPLISTTDAPLITDFSPSNGATSVELSSDLVVTFDQDLVPWNGNVIVTNLTDSSATVFAVTGAQVSVDGAMLTINADANLELGDEYAVLIDSTALRNSAGTYFAGISDTSTWVFTASAADAVGPGLVSTDPATGATQVQVDSDLLATFDEAVILRPGGTITLTNLTDSSATTITLTNAQVSVSGDTVTINPTADLEWGDTYAVLISSNAVADVFTNDFVGITNAATWQFTTDPQPFVTALTPTNGATNALASYTQRATFSEDITLTGAGTIALTNVTDGTAISLALPDDQVTVSGDVLIISLTNNLALAEQYAVLISGGAITDLAGNPFPGIADTSTWHFTTRGDDANWGLVAYWPMTDGPVDEAVTVADDVIDDSTHPATDATSNGDGNTWVMDAELDRIVLSTTENFRLSAGKVGIIDGEPFTWSLWVKSTDTTTTGEFPNDDSGVNAIFGTDANSFRMLNYRIDGFATVDGFELSDGTWHNIVVRGTGESVAVYVDGTFIGEDTTLGTAPTTQNLSIGGKSQFSEDFTGLISDVAIWVEALSEERIQRLASGEPPTGPVYRAPKLILIVR